jgi:hypothetical protein
MKKVCSRSTRKKLPFDDVEESPEKPRASPKKTVQSSVPLLLVPESL